MIRPERKPPDIPHPRMALSAQRDQLSVRRRHAHARVAEALVMRIARAPAADYTRLGLDPSTVFWGFG